MAPPSNIALLPTKTQLRTVGLLSKQYIPPPLAPEPPLPSFETHEPPREQPLENPQIGARRRAPQGGDGGRGASTSGEVGSGSFRREVEELQKTGLEIVFVFDSTGSMTSTINDTKATIVEMCDVLRALESISRG